MTCKCLKLNGGADRDRTYDLLNAMYALFNWLIFHIFICPCKSLPFSNHRNNEWDAIRHILKLYRIEEVVQTKKLMVKEYTDGSMAIWCRVQKKVKFRQIAIRPEKHQKPQKQSAIPARRKVITPPKDHTWRRFLYGSNKRKKVAAWIPDISILVKTGHFYFGLTQGSGVIAFSLPVC